jgi:hypothetical protein
MLDNWGMDNFRKGFVSLVLLIIVGVMVIGGGVFLFQSTTSKNEVEDNVVATTTVKAIDTKKVESPSPITKPTASNTTTASVKPKTPITPKPKVSPPTLGSAKVVSEATVGALVYNETDGHFLYPNIREFKISPIDKNPKEFTVNGTTVTFKALEAHEYSDEDFIPYSKEICESDRAECLDDDDKDWMVISINGKSIQFGLYEIKKITFSNGLVIYFSALDIEGSSSGYYGSDVAFAAGE